jgi:hypothetical protein
MRVVKGFAKTLDTLPSEAKLERLIVGSIDRTDHFSFTKPREFPDTSVPSPE